MTFRLKSSSSSSIASSMAHSIRDAGHLTCSHSAMGMWLCYRFTIQRAAIPDPSDEGAWQSSALFPAENPHAGVTPSEVRDEVHKSGVLYHGKKSGIFMPAGRLKRPAASGKVRLCGACVTFLQMSPVSAPAAQPLCTA